jgi:hypothetical protein
VDSVTALKSCKVLLGEVIGSASRSYFGHKQSLQNCIHVWTTEPVSIVSTQHALAGSTVWNHSVLKMRGGKCLNACTGW